MKKALFLVAVATLFFSCQRENIPSTEKGIIFKASIEDLSSPTKADYDATLGFKWAKADSIGIYVNDNGWQEKNQRFDLIGNGGSNSGSFEYHWGSFTNTNANAAFFPWDGQWKSGNEDHNYVDAYGYLHIKMREGYYNYTDGQMLTPLVAPVTRTGDAYDDIEFKHIGAAVKLTIANLPAMAHSIGMTVEGQQVFGGYYAQVPAKDTDPAAMASESGTNTNSTVWLNYATGTGNRSFNFVFPIPPVTAPKLSFQIYDKYGVRIWHRSLKAQSVDLGRKEMLVFRTPVTITQYEDINSVSSEWSVVGSTGGWENDIPMVTDGISCIATNLTLAAGAELKVRKDKAWTESYGEGSNNKVVPADGIYDVVFDLSSHTVTLATHGDCPYPSPTNFSVGSNLHTPEDLGGTFATYFN